jgi:hypothetical protein
VARSIPRHQGGRGDMRDMEGLNEGLNP